MSVGGIEENLRRNVVWRATDCLLPFTGAFDESSKPKVTDFDIHVRIEKEVAKFQITVDDLMGVHIVTCTDELDHEESGFGFSEATATTEHVHERATGAKFERHVDVGLIFKTFLETNNIGVLQGLVDLDFGVQLHVCLVVDAKAILLGWFTLVLAFLVLSEFFVTTLQASLS